MNKKLCKKCPYLLRKTKDKNIKLLFVVSELFDDGIEVRLVESNGHSSQFVCFCRIEKLGVGIKGGNMIIEPEIIRIDSKSCPFYLEHCLHDWNKKNECRNL